MNLVRGELRPPRSKNVNIKNATVHQSLHDTAITNASGGIQKLQKLTLLVTAIQIVSKKNWHRLVSTELMLPRSLRDQGEINWNVYERASVDPRTICA